LLKQHCPCATVELQVDGTYVARMEARDGAFGFDFEAVYDAVEPYHALTLRMDDGRAAADRRGASERVADLLPLEPDEHRPPAASIRRDIPLPQTRQVKPQRAHQQCAAHIASRIVGQASDHLHRL